MLKSSLRGGRSTIHSHTPHKHTHTNTNTHESSVRKGCVARLSPAHTRTHSLSLSLSLTHTHTQNTHTQRCWRSCFAASFALCLECTLTAVVMSCGHTRNTTLSRRLDTHTHTHTLTHEHTHALTHKNTHTRSTLRLWSLQDARGGWRGQRGRGRQTSIYPTRLWLLPVYRCHPSRASQATCCWQERCRLHLSYLDGPLVHTVSLLDGPFARSAKTRMRGQHQSTSPQHRLRRVCCPPDTAP